VKIDFQHLGGHLGFLKMLNDARVASSSFGMSRPWGLEKCKKTSAGLKNKVHAKTNGLVPRLLVFVDG